MRQLVFFLFLLPAFSGCGQEPQWHFIPVVDTHTVSLGDTVRTVIRYRYHQTSQPFFVHLHHNEQTADSVLHQYLGEHGGTAIGLQNDRQRLVTFSINAKKFLFDPNRMFTARGRRQSLHLLSSYNEQAATFVAAFARRLVSLFPPSVPVIALHNNTDSAYAFHWYDNGGDLAGETKALYRNPQMDPDDFVLTTHEPLFHHLKAAAINVILQDNTKANDDGSLGYYLGRHGRLYVNVEAEHGHFAEQLRILEAVLSGLSSY